MSDAAYHELFPLGASDAPYRKLTGDYVSLGTFEPTSTSSAMCQLQTYALQQTQVRG